MSFRPRASSPIGADRRHRRGSRRLLPAALRRRSATGGPNVMAALAGVEVDADPGAQRHAGIAARGRGAQRADVRLHRRRRGSGAADASACGSGWRRRASPSSSTSPPRGRTSRIRHQRDLRLIDLATSKVVVTDTTFARVSYDIPGQQQRFARSAACATPRPARRRSSPTTSATGWRRISRLERDARSRSAERRCLRFAPQRDPPGIVLIYGPDAGLVRERVDAMLANAVDDPNDPFSLARLEGDALADDPQRLVEEANTMPLFGGRRAVHVQAPAARISPPRSRCSPPRRPAPIAAS